ncbi:MULTISPECIES: hypothetical protein [Micromonospora]|uniref:Uncharacterized protein n=1 Tax=Micromonospora yangpuensis TaxID=683228 RepID=A0A1C6U5I3_9ACTN|nr:hypothetical protein [Micromonospora yangpuensis]GGL91985.1 hypothetical protein GCM10012279_07150 [Micromonospora yangpuensis]SCL49171.1 hypothetical protein GA0070617_1102 [Micromonospora yangpuensis]
MSVRNFFVGWHRNRYVWAAVVLLAVSAGAAVLAKSAPEPEPPDLRAQITSRMRTILEQADPGQHNHAGHQPQQVADAPARTPVICGVHVYGHEPDTATVLADVRTVYGYHFCGVAEQDRPWDVAVKLTGPLIMDMATEPPGIQVVEGTGEVRFVDRLREMFPEKYEQLALKEALTESEMADLRRRYDAAAGL